MRIAVVCAPPWLQNIPPLSLPTLKSILQLSGQEVSVIDVTPSFSESHSVRYRLFSLTNSILSILPQMLTNKLYKLCTFPQSFHNNIIRKLTDKDIDAVFFSTYKNNLYCSLYYAHEIKKISLKKPIAFGGPACYFRKTRDIIISQNVADHLATDSGEKSLSGILSRITGKKTEITLDFEKELTPDFDDLDLSFYQLEMLPYATTRGCYKKCKFCSDRFIWPRFIAKSPEKVYEDLRILNHKYAIEKFHFSDSIMFGSKKNIERFCELIIENNLSISWYGRGDPNFIDYKILKKMLHAGCRGLNFGIESGSQRILNHMQKGFKLEKMERIIECAKKIGISIKACFIVGYPTETWTDYFKTIAFCRRNLGCLSHVRINPLWILEGTILWNQAGEMGIKNRDKPYWSSKNSNFLNRMTKLMLLKLIIRLRL